MERKFLENKVALITGGGGGIGWGIGLEFAREGAQVILADINRQKGEEVLGELRKVSDGHLFVEMDVRKVGMFEGLLEQVEKNLGKIDILINNAGVNTSHAFLDMTPEAWDNVHDTNLRASMFLSQAVVRRMVDGGRTGNVLFITSVHQEVIQGRPHYSSSKAGLKMLVKEMAVELAGYGIRVNGIAPGGIYIDKRIEDQMEANKESSVLLGGRNGIPRDIGRAAVFLSSDYWSRHVTGEVLTVSGGQYLDSRLIDR
jgi:NAD(P)-dependent dehydrogenase (short-subunit alcohol dehydrogenase family)